MLKITMNTSSIVSELERMAARVPRAVAATLDDVANDLVVPEAIRQTEQIDERSIPRSRRGRPLWTRTGRLKRSIKARASAKRATVTWEAPYAQDRFALGVTRQPKNPAGGVVRKNNAPADTQEAIKGKLRPYAEQRFNEHMRRG
jgi:hypothetical protein